MYAPAAASVRPCAACSCSPGISPLRPQNPCSCPFCPSAGACCCSGCRCWFRIACSCPRLPPSGSRPVPAAAGAGFPASVRLCAACSCSPGISAPCACKTPAAALYARLRVPAAGAARFTWYQLPPVRIAPGAGSWFTYKKGSPLQLRRFPWLLNCRQYLRPQFCQLLRLYQIKPARCVQVAGKLCKAPI